MTLSPRAASQVSREAVLCVPERGSAGVSVCICMSKAARARVCSVVTWQGTGSYETFQ